MIPVLFSFGSFHVYSFGLMVALGVFVSLFLMERRAVKHGFPTKEMALDFVFVTVIFGFLGARVDYIFQNLQEYLKNPLQIFAFWEGGLIFYGGVAGSFLALGSFCRIKKISFPRALDFILPFIALTHAFGRMGCFLNACCNGKVCDLPWAVKFPATETFVHPVQLYEAALNILLFFILSKVYEDDQKNIEKSKPGKTALVYFFSYGLIRFVMEYYRTENPFIGPLTINQWVSICLMAVSAVFYAMRLQTGKKSK